MLKHQKLLEVPIAYLKAGLILKDNVYDKNGTVLLIPSGELITEKKLDQLTHFGDHNQCVTTYRKSFEIIMQGNKKEIERDQKILESESGYTALKTGVEHVLKISQRAAQLDSEEVEEVIRDVMDKLHQMNPDAIFGCIHVPRPLDEKLQRHSLNVGFLNGMMGQWLELNDEQIRMLVMTGILHDIGKTKIPEEIINAPQN